MKACTVILVAVAAALSGVRGADVGNFPLGRTCFDAISTPGFVTVPSHIVQKLRPSDGNASIYVSLVYASGGVRCCTSCPYSKWGCCGHYGLEKALNMFLTTDNTRSPSSILFPVDTIVPTSYFRAGGWYHWTGHAINDPVLAMPIKWPVTINSNEGSLSFYIYYAEVLYQWTTGDNWGSVCVDVFIGSKPQPPTQQSKNCDICCSKNLPETASGTASQLNISPSEISVIGGTSLRLQSSMFPVGNFTAICSFKDPVLNSSKDVVGSVVGQDVVCITPLLYDTGSVPVSVKATDDKGQQTTLTSSVTAEVAHFAGFDVEFVRNGGQLNDPINSIKVAWNKHDKVLENASRIDFALFYVSDDAASEWSFALYLSKNAPNSGFLQIDQTVFGATFNKLARTYGDVSYLFSITKSGLLETAYSAQVLGNRRKRSNPIRVGIALATIYGVIKRSFGSSRAGGGDINVNNNGPGSVNINICTGICIYPPPAPVPPPPPPGPGDNGDGAGGAPCPKPKCPPPGGKCKGKKCKKYNKGGCKRSTGGGGGNCGSGLGTGDPHFTTFDGLYYTHMGRGEFWLFFPLPVKAGLQTSPIISLQGRMVLHSWWPDATWFTAFAGLVNHQFYPTLFQIENDPNSKALLIHLNGTKVVTEPGQWYYPGFTLEIASDGVEATVFTKQVTFVFTRASDYSLNVMSYVDYKLRKNKTFFSFWGNFDGDSSDDLMAPDGSLIASTASIRQIQSHFRKWQLRSTSESFFRYPTGQSFETYSFPDWEPRYYDASNPPAQAVSVCGTSKGCLYDYQATGDNADAAKLTAAAEKKFDEEMERNNNSCAEVERPENGFVDLVEGDVGDNGRAEIGSTINFSCYATFSLVGATATKCLANRTWSSPTPKCTAFAHASATGAPVGVIVGSVIGAVIALALIIAAVFCIKKQKEKKSTQTRTPRSGTSAEGEASKTLMNK